VTVLYLDLTSVLCGVTVLYLDLTSVLCGVTVLCLDLTSVLWGDCFSESSLAARNKNRRY